MDIYQGDPALFLDENGSELIFKGGQPILDQGLENAAKISLFTEGWFGNVLFDEESQRVGSNFESENRKPITATNLQSREQSAIDALQWLIDDGIASNVEVEASNENGVKVDYIIRIFPVGRDVQELRVSENGLNWIAQFFNPAHGRV